MPDSNNGAQIEIRIIETPEEMVAVERLQEEVWPGDEREIVPIHMLVASVHNGGLVIGAYASGPSNNGEAEGKLVGFVFGFPGFDHDSQGIKPKHCSHMMGVLTKYRNLGIGFNLKRAQWQMVRRQGLDRITWTYDPLLSQNAYLNIARLGAVCNTYIQEAYGEMRDGLNIGFPSDRFRVDWWVNSSRATRRLGKRPRKKLDLAHFMAADVSILNPSNLDDDGHPYPQNIQLEELFQGFENQPVLVLVEIPTDFMALKAANPDLGLEWRLHSRQVLVHLFERGYLVTDFIHLPGKFGRSFYVMSHGEATL